MQPTDKTHNEPQSASTKLDPQHMKPQPFIHPGLLELVRALARHCAQADIAAQRTHGTCPRKNR